MSVPFVKTAWDIFNGGGVPALLFLIVWGGVRQWYVYGWQYRQKVAECEKWQQLALSGTELATRAVAQAEAVRNP